MGNTTGLRHGALGVSCRHICVDMQRMFLEDTPWKMPWMGRVLPKAVELVAAQPARTIFTRFIPARHPGEGEGTWRQYYRRWHAMTLSEIGDDMVDIVAPLQRFTPPAAVLDKKVYSPWHTAELDSRLRHEGVDTLAISGGETDVCVLATVLGAVDRGYRVVIAADALCSSSDEAHDASMTVYATRYGQQVETASTEDILRAWS
ncbi:MAG: isochorismatase hydrolase [Rubritepida sp.]|nr:isochorismatase hydrolase [Rubritepida sp.]